MKKLELKLLVLCDLASVSREGKLSIIGIFDRIFANKIPSSFIRLFVVATIEGEPSVDYQIKLNIQDPQGKEILPPKFLKVRLGGNGRSNLITDIVNMPLPEFGEYTLSLKSDDKELGNTIFWVSKIESGDDKNKNPIN